jgi:hypothetical protein
MVHSTHGPHVDFPADIDLTAGIGILNQSEILPPSNTGFSMRREGYLCFPDEEKGERAIPWSLPLESAAAEFPLWQRLHGFIYQERTDLRVLITSRLPYTLTAAQAGRQVPPLLDDFAQLVGVTVRVVREAENEARFFQRILKGLRHRNAVLIPQWGGLCAATTFDDALAVVQVLEKGCRARIDSAFLGGGFRINPLEAWLMRLVYKYKYAKMKSAGG